MKIITRIYTIKCTQPVTDSQLLNIKSLLGVDKIDYAYPKLTIYYDLHFINREILIKHLKQENISSKESILKKLANFLEIFSEKSIIKNNRLLPFYE